jgi:hypothetical protein
MLDGFRDSINSGNAKVDLMGKNYTIKPNSFTVTVKKSILSLTFIGFAIALHVERRILAFQGKQPNEYCD